MSDVPEMVERAKRAFLDALTEGGCRVVDGYGDSAGEIDIADAARAAIAEMREPTEAMLNARVPLNPRTTEEFIVEAPYAKRLDLWRAMIDAALS